MCLFVYSILKAVRFGFWCALGAR